MREIKFRAWEPGTKTMWHDNAESRYNEVLKKEYNQNLMMRLDGGIRTCQWYDNGVTMHDHTAFEVMQYTGLKDRNGKEIYEGDILSLLELGVSSKFTSKEAVKFDERFGGFAPFCYPYFYNRDWAIEVIGNIYENPELIGK